MKSLKFATIALAAMMPLSGMVPTQEFTSNTAAAAETVEDISSMKESIAGVQGISLLPATSPAGPQKVMHSLRVIVTAYSSTPDQTDDTPFITASGKYVRDGIVATNLLPLGTKIQIPSIYGDRVFVVEDRMHPRMTQHVDIWFPSTWEARKFGVKPANIYVLGG